MIPINALNKFLKNTLWKYNTNTIKFILNITLSMTWRVKRKYESKAKNIMKKMSSKKIEWIQNDIFEWNMQRNIVFMKNIA